MRSKLDNLPVGVDGKLVAKILDISKSVEESRGIKYTEFLDPFHRQFVRPFIANSFGVRFLEDGGYPGAERRRLVLFPDYFAPADIEVPIAIIAVELSDPTRILSHRDYLGALISLGIKRSYLGDILSFPGGAHVVAAGEVSDLVLSLTGVNSLNVITSEIPPYSINWQEQPLRTLSSTVASVRLDAVLSVGLGIGRSKATDLVKSSRVKVNWREISQPSFSLKTGDVISIRGLGRLELSCIGSETKKGRTRIQVNKFG